MFLSLGAHPPANAFLTKNLLRRAERTWPLDIYVCLDCALIQVRNCLPKRFFRNYLYIPSASDTMIDHFSRFAKELTERFALSRDSLVVDIGSNDGTFLGNFKKSAIRVLGIEPASNLAKVARANGVETVNEYFSKVTAVKVREKYGRASVIVTTNTFNHVDDLHKFLAGVVTLLHDRGTFVIEVPHALELVQNNEFDTIYHEHLSQFSVQSLVQLFGACDMEIVDIEQLPIHGGSMRVWASNKTGGRGGTQAAERWVAREKRARLFSRSTYERLSRRITENKRKLWKILTSIKSRGQRVAGYGAPAKGNTLLNYYQIGTETVDYLVDRSPLKHGLYSPGMHIPILPVGKILDERPEYLLILAWNFATEIIHQQEEYRALGGKFIVPIPEPRIVGV
jgi:SAM-dependent methyltransferase